MNDTVAVSVICDTYNQEQYIAKALDGFVHQITDFRYEVIVHDDASTDRTPEIILHYAAQYPDLIIPVLEEKNLYQNGNEGLISIKCNEKAHGRYVAMCDGDDFWTDPYKLQKQYDAMESHPEASLCVHAVATCNKNGDLNNERIFESLYGQYITGDQDVNLLPDETKWAIFFTKWGFRHCFQTSSYFFRRGLYEERIRLIKYNNPMVTSLSGDRAILLLAFNSGFVIFLRDCMSVYRINSKGSWSESTGAEGEAGVRKRMDGELCALDAYRRYVSPDKRQRINKIFINSCAAGRLNWNYQDSIDRCKQYHVTFMDVMRYGYFRTKLYWIGIRCFPGLMKRIGRLRAGTAGQ